MPVVNKNPFFGHVAASTLSVFATSTCSVFGSKFVVVVIQCNIAGTVILLGRGGEQAIPFTLTILT